MNNTNPCPHCNKPVSEYGPIGAIFIIKQCPDWLIKNIIKNLQKFIKKEK